MGMKHKLVAGSVWGVRQKSSWAYFTGRCSQEMSRLLDIEPVQLAPSFQIFVSFVPFCKKLPAPYAWPQEKNRRERRKRRIQDPGQCAHSTLDGSRRILSHTLKRENKRIRVFPAGGGRNSSF